MKKYEELNKTEKFAVRNAKHAFNFCVGGYYNLLQDGMTDELKGLTKELIINEVYSEATNTIFGFNTRDRHMRFAGKQLIMDFINKWYDEDSDIKEIEPYF